MKEAPYIISGSTQAELVAAILAAVPVAMVNRSGAAQRNQFITQLKNRATAQVAVAND